MLLFQCDLCHFLNIQKRDPKDTNHQDWLILLVIRNVNFDRFWSRESMMMFANFSEATIFGMEDKIFP